MRTATTHDLRRVLELANLALRYEADRINQSDVDSINRLKKLVEHKSDEIELKV